VVRDPGSRTTGREAMLVRLLLLFVLVPLIELALLIRIGSWLGFWPTMALVIATGALGAVLARSQGTRVLREIRNDLVERRVPTGRLLDGMLVLVGGVVLLTPGLITDIVGLLLLVPFTRQRLKEIVRRRFERMVRSGEVGTITLIR
jgi:UPF0716 protein FxsA